MSTVGVIFLSIFGFSLLLIVIALAVLGARSLVENARTKEIWIAFAASIGGQLDEGMAGKVDIIRADLGGWPAYVDSAIASAHGRLINYTRMRVFYRPCRPFEAYICDKDVAPDIPPNNGAIASMAAPSELKNNVVLRSSDPVLLLSLLTPECVRLINDTHMVDLQIRRRRNWKNGGVSSSIFEVYLQHEGPVASVDAMSAMWRLMEGCLIRLHHLGIAGHLADVIR